MASFSTVAMASFSSVVDSLTSLTGAIYKLTEESPIESPLARQLLHLACHAENMDALIAGRDSSGLVLDRWWWSTLAYGWYGADLAQKGVPDEVFRGLIRAVWAPIVADLVLVFSKPFTDDPLNLRGVREGYTHLLAAAGETAFEVPAVDADATTEAIRWVLLERGILITDEPGSAH